MNSDSVMLIVDDSKLARKVIRTITGEVRPDLSIIEAGNGDEAREISSGQDIEIMTIDYNMPGMDGIALATEMKASNPQARIGLLTANVQEAVRSRAKDLEIEFIPKPITKDKLEGLLA